LPSDHDPSSASALTTAEDVPLEDKIGFLSSPAAFECSTGEVSVSETHMSYVFICADRVLKIKKPVQHSFLDFSTIAARKFNCEQEVSLNARLAPDVYLGVKALRQASNGKFEIDGNGRIVDWLVSMRRLPAQSMLDRILQTGALLPDHIDQLAQRLALFYRSAKRPHLSAKIYFERILAEHEISRRILTQRNFQLDHGRIPTFLRKMDEALKSARPLLEQRAENGEIVEGHGDLRPEHICFENGIVIFDCLEFNADLRTIDPADELAFLGMECAMLGAETFGPTLFAKVFAILNRPSPVAIFEIYQAMRAELRARLTLAHLLDAKPREPTKWEPLARRYLALAEASLIRFTRASV
jgi:aminoglycoside phosphotransferase family enzyme